MKKIRKNSFFALLMIFTLLLSSQYAYAEDNMSVGNVRQITNVKQYKGSRQTRVVGTPRGVLLSSADIRLTDKGGGTIGIYADLLCHEPVKKIRMWLYLEKWIPEEEVWETVEYEQFSWLSEDFPDQDLTMAVASYDVTKLERGQDYRVRGLFGADALTSDLKETWSVYTPNLVLE